MLLTIDEMVALLRSSVNIQTGSESVIDPSYLSMTDDDIKLFIKLGITRAYPDVDNLLDLPDGSEYAIVLLAKMELYLKLAVVRADKVDIGADNNNYIKQSQRFDHYMKLAEDAKNAYNDWIENEGGGDSNRVSTYDVLLSNRHYTRRNYEKQSTPKVRVMIDSVTSDSVEFSWKVSNTSHFGRYKVYINTSPIVDIFNDGAMYYSKIIEGATLIKNTSNIRDCHHKVSGLSADTPYYIAVFSIERNQVFGYKEVSFTTLEELADEEDSSVDGI